MSVSPNSIFNTNIIKQYFIDANLIRALVNNTYGVQIGNTILTNTKNSTNATFCNYNWLPYINLSTPIKMNNNIKWVMKIKTKNHENVGIHNVTANITLPNNKNNNDFTNLKIYNTDIARRLSTITAGYRSRK